MIRHSQELSLGHAIENGTFIGNVPYHKHGDGSSGGLGLLVEKTGGHPTGPGNGVCIGKNLPASTS